MGWKPCFLNSMFLWCATLFLSNQTDGLVPLLSSWPPDTHTHAHTSNQTATHCLNLWQQELLHFSVCFLYSTSGIITVELIPTHFPAAVIIFLDEETDWSQAALSGTVTHAMSRSLNSHNSRNSKASTTVLILYSHCTCVSLCVYVCERVRERGRYGNQLSCKSGHLDFNWCLLLSPITEITGITSAFK